MSIVLSVVVAAILPGQQASAKQCRGNNDNKNNNNDKGDTHGTSCKHDQDNSENHHDDSSTTRKDKIPFRLPFP
jgi:hypothetical protein